MSKTAPMIKLKELFKELADKWLDVALSVCDTKHDPQPARVWCREEHAMRIEQFNTAADEWREEWTEEFVMKFRDGVETIFDSYLSSL
jgi:hypothetical protein